VHFTRCSTSGSGKALHTMGALFMDHIKETMNFPIPRQYDSKYAAIYWFVGGFFVLQGFDHFWCMFTAFMSFIYQNTFPPPGHPRAMRRWDRLVKLGKPTSSKSGRTLWSSNRTKKVTATIDESHQGAIGAVAPTASTEGVHPSLVSQYTSYPLVLIQVPMYNEDAHCEAVVERVCQMAWPRNRVLFQICDDSTDAAIRQRVDDAVQKAQAQGNWVMLTRRDERKGYKAGNLLHGMECVKSIPFNYVAVFDADFSPPKDYLFQTVHNMESNPSLGFVQARWTFTNKWSPVVFVQKMQLNMHFMCEQRGRSFFSHCFCFNGSAGVWSMKCYNDVGGWNTDTLVEDTDMAARAYIRGWRFLYLHWVECASDLCPTYAAFKSQQYRWSCGPMQVMCKVLPKALREKGGFRSKIDVFWFLCRPIIGVFCVIGVTILPPVAIWLAPWGWPWTAEQCAVFAGAMWMILYYLPVSIGSFPYLMFCNCFSWFRLYAYWHGVTGVKKALTWKVTLKVGDGTRHKMVYHKPYVLELMGAVYYALVAAAGGWTVYMQWDPMGDHKESSKLVAVAYSFLFCCIFLGLAFGDYWMC